MDDRLATERLGPVLQLDERPLGLAETEPVQCSPALRCNRMVRRDGDRLA